MGNRKWPRSDLIDHPLLNSKDPRAYSNLGKDKPKVFCRECWTWQFSEEQQRDQADIAAGKRREPRSQQEIEAYRECFKFIRHSLFDAKYIFGSLVS